MSWLGELWDRNRNWTGNLVKNVAPALAFVPGLGIPASFAAGAAGRAMQKGTNFGDILKSGLSNAAVGGGARSAASLAGKAFGGGGAIPSSPSGFSSTPGGGWQAAGSQPFTPSSAVETAANTGGGSWLSKAGGFAKDNAQTIGALANAGANAYGAGLDRDADAERFNFQRQQYDDETERRKRMAELLAPLWQQISTGQRTVAPNPYTRGG